MNNEEKNTYVKGQITRALLDLLMAKELRDIAVSEITTAAQVSRVSFYRNYEEKQDVLNEHIDRLFKDWWSEYEKRQTKSEDEMLGCLFGHLHEYRAFYQLLNRRNLLHLLKQRMNQIIGPRPDYPNHAAYTAAFIASGLYGWIEEWFARGMQESAEEMTILLKHRWETQPEN